MSYSPFMCSQNNNYLKAYLFFSVDICNSTRYKLYNESWNSIFKEFFKKFSVSFNDNIDREKDNYKLIQNEERDIAELTYPIKWKLIGDEILYYVEIKEYYEQVLFIIIAFRNTINEFNLNDNKSNLELKGTIWFVNISNYRNTNIELTTEIQGHSLNDFLGTSIDIGFRLSRFSSTEKITISVETAILLMRDNYLTLEEKGINVYFDGTTKLKGIDPLICDYPILWIDLLDKKEVERLKTSDDRSKLQISKRKIQKQVFRI